MTQHTTIDATVRNAAFRLLANGDATVAEIAALVGASRQRVQYWADQAGLDASARRRTRLAERWLTAQIDDIRVERRVTAKLANAKRLPKRKQIKKGARVP